MISDDLGLGWQSCMHLRTEIGPIEDAAKIRRTWNGTPVNLARTDAFRRLRVTLSCDGDLLPPSIAHLWPGERFQLVPAEELSEPTTMPQQRQAYEGSLYILDEHAQPAESGRRFYRPVFDLVVTEPWRMTSEENRGAGSVSWTLVAEEYSVLPVEPEEE